MTRWFWPAAALTVLAWASVAYVAWIEQDRFLERVPVHWDINFQPDRYAPLQEAISYFLLMPGVMTFVLWMSLALPWASPEQFSVERFRTVFGYIMALVVALMGLLHTVIILVTLVPGTDWWRWYLGGFFLFFALLGNVLGQVRRNFWVGVRTPWTLASEPVWERTHRVAAWLFVGVGVAGCVASLLGVPLLWCLAGLVVGVLWPVGYSLWLYKRLEKQGRL